MAADTALIHKVAPYIKLRLTWTCDTVLGAPFLLTDSTIRIQEAYSFKNEV